MRHAVLGRRYVLRAALAVVAASALVPVHGARASDVTAAIEQLNAGLLQAMKLGKSTPFQQRYELLLPLVSRALDLDYILQEALGSGWTALSRDQQGILRGAFQRYCAATYASNFDAFGGERFDLLATEAAAGGNPVVRVRITPGSPGEEAHILSYVMRRSDGGWKAFDVRADGSISQVGAQQAELRSLFSRSGSDGLLARLRLKATELSGGTLHN